MIPTAVRPAPPFDSPPGARWVASPADGWSTEPDVITGLTCRRFVGHRNEHSGTPAVAVLFRNRARYREPMNLEAYVARWGYCAEHLYGRWIEDGVVFEWRLIPIGVEP